MSSIIFKQQDTDEERIIAKTIEFAKFLSDINSSKDGVCASCGKVHSISREDFTAGFFVSSFHDRDLVSGVGDTDDIVRAICKWADRDHELVFALITALVELTFNRSNQ